MSGECDKCSEHCLDCKCGSLCAYPQTDLQPLSRSQENGLEDGIEPPTEQIPTKYINVNGREEHEALLKDSEKCKELGLDQVYETIVYLKHWGGWLRE